MTTTFSGRSGRLVLASLALAAVAGLSTTAVAVARDDAPSSPATSAAATTTSPSTSPATSTAGGAEVSETPVGQQPVPGYTGAGGRFLELDPAWVPPGTTVRTGDGWSAVVSPDSSRFRLTAPDGRQWSTRLGLTADGSPNLLSATRLMLGQAGEGYVVSTGEPGQELTVITLRSDRIRTALVTGGVPIGNGTTEDGRAYRTWFSGGVLRTAVALTAEDPRQVALHYWGVSGPGEGSDHADPETVDLMPAPEGTYCLTGEPGSGTAARCEVPRDESQLPTPDVTTGQGVGRSVAFPSGTYGRLQRGERGLDLVLTGPDGAPQRVAIPGAGYAELITSELRIDGRTAYLVQREGGDSTAAFLVVVGDDGPFLARVAEGDTYFGSGFSPDGRSERLVVAGGGTALYSQIELPGGGGDVRLWRLDDAGTLTAVAVG